MLACLLLACLACTRDLEPAVAAAPPPKFNAGLHWTPVSVRTNASAFTLLATRDRQRKLFHGAVDFKLTLPADIPAQRVWSIVVRDSASLALMG